MPKKPRYHRPSLRPLIMVLAIVAGLTIFWSQIAKWVIS